MNNDDEELDERIKIIIRRNNGSYITIRAPIEVPISELKQRISRRLYRENLKKEQQKQTDGTDNLIDTVAPVGATSATPPVIPATTTSSSTTSTASAPSGAPVIPEETRKKIIEEYAKKYELYYHGKQLYDLSMNTTVIPHVPYSPEHKKTLEEYQKEYKIPTDEDIILDLVVFEPKIYNSDSVDIMLMENTLFHHKDSMYSGYESSPFIRTAYIKVSEEEPEALSYDWFKVHTDNIDAKLAATRKIATGKQINTKRLRFTVKNVSRAKKQKKP
jgi:hypothetical protein